MHDVFNHSDFQNSFEFLMTSSTKSESELSPSPAFDSGGIYPVISDHSHRHSETQEGWTGCYRHAELPAHLQPLLYVKGCRENRRQSTTRLPELQLTASPSFSRVFDRRIPPNQLSFESCPTFSQPSINNRSRC